MKRRSPGKTNAFFCLMRFACLWTLIGVGCSDSASSDCNNDQDCQDAVRAGYDPAKNQCQIEKHFCYEGCKSDEECQDPSKSWYLPDRPFCDSVTHDCVAGANHNSFDGGRLNNDALRPLGNSCTSGSQCGSGFCVDGVCCDAACGELCRACNLPGTSGHCRFIPAEAGPTSECLGDAWCGLGQCDGQGACRYPQAGTECKKECGEGQVQIYTCDAAHQCQKSSIESCNFGRCEPATQTCLEGCNDQDDCIPSSLCDRSEAHLTGKGQCVDPQKIVTRQKDQTMADALAKINNNRPYLKVLEDIPTSDGFVVLNKLNFETIYLVGINPNAPPLIPYVEIGEGFNVVVQGLRIGGGESNFGGIYCSTYNYETGTENIGASKVTVVESTLAYAAETGLGVCFGISAYGCDVTLRRNIFHHNLCGGAWLKHGNFIVENNLVTNNGTTEVEDKYGGSKVGGFEIIPGANGKVVFVNNTVINNVARKDGHTGIICDGKFTIYNSIFWNPLGAVAETDNCAFAYSDVRSNPPGEGNVAVDPAVNNESHPTAQQCLNSGLNTATGLGVIDLQGASRIQGGTIDLGAYEVK